MDGSGMPTMNAGRSLSGLTQLSHRFMGQLSCGQKQRVWIAMILAQDTKVLMLDEPTNHLDLKYRIEILDLLVSFNNNANKTIIVVLHDINLASRYAQHLVALKNGKIHASGCPKEIVTSQFVEEIFDIQAHIIPCPLFGTSLCIPYNRNHLNGNHKSDLDLTGRKTSTQT